jgi:hypothetical protein
MTTTKFIKEIKKNINYKITPTSLELSKQGITLYIIKKRPNINKTFIKCDWNQQNTPLQTDSSNILGSSSKLEVTSNINIPTINSDALWYYNTKLYNINDIISFDEDLPLFEMEVGRNYVPEYIMKKAGGVYLEEHTRPHFHMPLTKEAAGHIILGKHTQGGIHVSAFQIPFGKALFMPNNTIHNDCFLTGKYNVIYSKTPDYKTMLLTHNDQPAKVTIHKSLDNL